jgi:hypothetical protein
MLRLAALIFCHERLRLPRLIANACRRIKPNFLERYERNLSGIAIFLKEWAVGQDSLPVSKF